MESLVSTFHIDVKLLIAQVINFGIVFAVLYFFALKPLLKVMADRSAKIEKSLEEAKEIEEKMNQAEGEYKKVVAEAKKEAVAVLAKAGELAEKKKEETIVKTREEIGQIINTEKEKMRQEKAQTIKEIKKEVADLVVLSLEKVLAEKIDPKKDKELIKKIVKGAK